MAATKSDRRGHAANGVVVVAVLQKQSIAGKQRIDRRHTPGVEK